MHPQANHHRISLTDPWGGAHRTDFCVYAAAKSDDAYIDRLLSGRGVLTFNLGGFSLSTRPTADELRLMAQAMLTMADQIDSAIPALSAA